MKVGPITGASAMADMSPIGGPGRIGVGIQRHP